MFFPRFRGRRALLWFLPLILWASPGLCFVADGTFQSAQRAFAPLDGRLGVRVTGRYLEFNEMREPLAYSLAAAMQPATAGWERMWRQSDWCATITYDILDTERFTLRPGVHLGVSQGRFKARNASIGFSETWDTRQAFLWGPSLAAEIRMRRKGGPFLSLAYDLFLAEAGEADETIASADNQGSRPEDRDAYFRWRRHEATAALGWRFGAFTPRAGVKYRDFLLKKSLSHHISTVGAVGSDLLLLQALNSRPSRYEYRSSTPWAPFVAFAWRVIPNVALSGEALLSRDKDFSLSVAFSF